MNNRSFEHFVIRSSYCDTLFKNTDISLVTIVHDRTRLVHCGISLRSSHYFQKKVKSKRFKFIFRIIHVYAATTWRMSRSIWKDFESKITNFIKSQFSSKPSLYVFVLDLCSKIFRRLVRDMGRPVLSRCWPRKKFCHVKNPF